MRPLVLLFTDFDYESKIELIDSISLKFQGFIGIINSFHRIHQKPICIIENPLDHINQSEKFFKVMNNQSSLVIIFFLRDKENSTIDYFEKLQEAKLIQFRQISMGARINKSVNFTIKTESELRKILNYYTMEKRKVILLTSKERSGNIVVPQGSKIILKDFASDWDEEIRQCTSNIIIISFRSERRFLLRRLKTLLWIKVIEHFE